MSIRQEQILSYSKAYSNNNSEVGYCHDIWSVNSSRSQIITEVLTQSVSGLHIFKFTAPHFSVCITHFGWTPPLKLCSDLLLAHTARHVQWLPCHHLDYNWTPRSVVVVVVVNAVAKVDSFSDAVTDLMPQYNPTDVGAVESMALLRSQAA